MKIYLMRHGEKGLLGQPLSPRGEREVDESIKQLRALGIGSSVFGVVLASPVPRAKATGQRVAEALKLPFATCQELEEWGFEYERMPNLANLLIDLAKNKELSVEQSTSVIAVTHQMIIDANIKDDEGMPIHSKTGDFYELS